MFDAIHLNTNERVNQQVYRILRKSIINCKILPGAVLSEKDISSQFNVSRQPVREAFIKLAEAGLVEIWPQRGTFVTKISVKKVIDGQFIREAVECAIIEKVAKSAQASDIKKLEHNLLEQKAALQAQSTQLFLEKDDEFHQILINILDCPMAWQTVEDIKAMVDRVRFLTLEEITPPSTLIEQHERIYRAIQEHNSKKAVVAQREHLRAILKSIKVVAKQNNDWFVE